jgi:hypothetical protein
MKKQVTLTLAPAVHARAKRIARARRTTVSGLVTAFVQGVSEGGKRTTKSLVDEMLGSAELRRPAPGRDPLFDALHDRYVAPRR